MPIPQAILKEARKRDALARFIDSLINARIGRVANCHTRLKRGVVHQLVADSLGLKLNSYIRGLANERMEAAGYRMAVMQGNRYYKHAVLKDAH